MNFEHLTVLQSTFSLFTGIGLGLVYMYLLWQTVVYLPKIQKKGRFLFFSAAARIFMLVFCATVLSFGEATRFLLIIVGFIIARLLVEKRIKKEIAQLTAARKTKQSKGRKSSE